MLLFILSLTPHQPQPVSRGRVGYGRKFTKILYIATLFYKFVYHTAHSVRYGTPHRALTTQQQDL